MGSKGSQTTTTNQNQTYSANPAIQGAAGQAISGAQSAASQPFQMPVAPVAGFNPQQQQAFNQYSQIQGMAQPYFDQASQYTAQSAAPITGADVNQYYNPMADNVTKQLQNIYGQQNSQNQGNLTAQAGGVGADRIAVGMGDLANQQGLASGQIYSQLYQQALQAAQQQKQMAAGAGSAFAGYGTSAQTAALQGTGALGQSGQIQQAQSQAELNAPYQNELAKIAYQFQTPQYLAGITGGLAPALGGTTIGNQQTTAPSPSWISQLLGVGTAGVGLAGAAGAFGGSGSTGGVGSYGQMANASGLGAGTGGMSFPMFGSRGGAAYADGGEVNNGGVRGGVRIGKLNLIEENRSPYIPPIMPMMAEGGATDEDQGPAIPGVHLPKAGGATPIPTVSLPMGGGHSGPLTGGLNFPSPQQSGSGDSGLGDIAKIAQMAMMFVNRGGAVKAYADGGGDDSNPDAPFASDLWTRAASHFGKSAPPTFYNPSGEGTGPPPRNFDDRFRDAFPAASPPAAAPVAPAAAAPPPVINPDTPYRMPDQKAVEDWRKGADLTRVPVTGGEEEDTAPAKAAPTAYNIPGRAAANPYVQPQAQQPYPDSLKRDWGQNATRSPWMALVKAGATMAATPGPIGSVIGKGILAGTSGLEGQRKELRSEQELNDKAQQLYQNAQVHLDKYTKMTPYEQGSLTARNREIDQAGETSTATADFKPAEVNAAIKAVNDKPENIGKRPEELQQLYALELARRKALRLGQQGVVPPAAATPTGAGSSKETALPDPGEGKREVGKWYIGPTGKPQPWVGP